MSLLLVRHGEAVQGGPDGDVPRFLSVRGRMETKSVGEQLRLAGLVPSTIVSSPLVRAVQTAEILAFALSYQGTVSTDVALVPEGDPSVFARRAPTGSSLTIVVCHEPIVRGIAALLAGQSSYPAFQTSAAVLFADGPGRRAVLGHYVP
jgi:phosphohistidine phosphatase